MTQKVPYLRFIDSITGLGNKNHNPFKSVVQKIEFFIETNKLTRQNLLKRAGAATSDGISVEKFADFLK